MSLTNNSRISFNYNGNIYLLIDIVITKDEFTSPDNNLSTIINLVTPTYINLFEKEILLNKYNLSNNGTSYIYKTIINTNIKTSTININDTYNLAVTVNSTTVNSTLKSFCSPVHQGTASVKLPTVTLDYGSYNLKTNYIPLDKYNSTSLTAKMTLKKEVTLNTTITINDPYSINITAKDINNTLLTEDYPVTVYLDSNKYTTVTLKNGTGTVTIPKATLLNTNIIEHALYIENTTSTANYTTSYYNTTFITPHNTDILLNPVINKVYYCNDPVNVTGRLYDNTLDLLDTTSFLSLNNWSITTGSVLPTISNGIATISAGSTDKINKFNFNQDNIYTRCSFDFQTSTGDQYAIIIFSNNSYIQISRGTTTLVNYKINGTVYSNIWTSTGNIVSDTNYHNCKVIKENNLFKIIIDNTIILNFPSIDDSSLFRIAFRKTNTGTLNIKNLSEIEIHNPLQGIQITDNKNNKLVTDNNGAFTQQYIIQSTDIGNSTSYVYTYNGSTDYNSSTETSNTITPSQENINIQTDDTVTANRLADINAYAYITDNKNNPLSNFNVIFKINKTLTRSVLTDNTGKASAVWTGQAFNNNTYTLNIIPGTYNCYLGVEKDITLIIRQLLTPTIVLTPTSPVIGSTATISVTFASALACDTNYTLYIDNTQIATGVIPNGTKNLQKSLVFIQTPGTHTLILNIIGNTYYQNNTITSTITLSNPAITTATVIVNDLTGDVNTDLKLSASAPSDTDGSIQFEYSDGTIIGVSSITNGYSEFIIPNGILGRGITKYQARLINSTKYGVTLSNTGNISVYETPKIAITSPTSLNGYAPGDTIPITVQAPYTNGGVLKYLLNGITIGTTAITDNITTYNAVIPSTLPPGVNYDLSIVYTPSSDSYYNTASTTINNIIFIKTTPNIIINSPDFSDPSVISVNLTTTIISTVTIDWYKDDTLITTCTLSDSVNIDLTNNDGDIVTIKAVYNGDNNYLPVTITKTIAVYSTPYISPRIQAGILKDTLTRLNIYVLDTTGLVKTPLTVNQDTVQIYNGSTNGFYSITLPKKQTPAVHEIMLNVNSDNQNLNTTQICDYKVYNNYNPTIPSNGYLVISPTSTRLNKLNGTLNDIIVYLSDSKFDTNYNILKTFLQSRTNTSTKIHAILPTYFFGGVYDGLNTTSVVDYAETNTNVTTKIEDRITKLCELGVDSIILAGNRRRNTTPNRTTIDYLNDAQREWCNYIHTNYPAMTIGGYYIPHSDLQGEIYTRGIDLNMYNSFYDYLIINPLWGTLEQITDISTLLANNSKFLNIPYALCVDSTVTTVDYTTQKSITQNNKIIELNKGGYT